MKWMIIILIGAIFNCNFRSNEGKKRNKCVQAYMATYTPAESLPYSTGGFSFRFSCSTDANFTPTCTEYFSKREIDPNYLCPIGYQKYSVRCSRQNLVGICHETKDLPELASGLVLVSVFSKPNHSQDDAKIYCQTNDTQKRNFFSEYRDPNDRSSQETQRWNALLLCLGQTLK